MSVRYEIAFLALVCLGCSQQAPAPSPATTTDSASTPVHAGEIHWQFSVEGAEFGSTTEIIPGHTTGTTSSQTYQDTTHTVTWRFIGPADGKDNYHFDMHLGTAKGIESFQKEIEYSGSEVLVHEGDNHTIVIRPKSSP